MTRYSDSAIKIKSNGHKTGISFNQYEGGEIYSDHDRLIVRLGKAGLSVLTNAGDEVLAADHAGIKLNFRNIIDPFYLWIGGFIMAVLIASLIMTYRTSRQLKEMRFLMAQYQSKNSS